MVFHGHAINRYIFINIIPIYTCLEFVNGIINRKPIKTAPSPVNSLDLRVLDKALISEKIAI